MASDGNITAEIDSVQPEPGGARAKLTELFGTNYSQFVSFQDKLGIKSGTPISSYQNSTGQTVFCAQTQPGQILEFQVNVDGSSGTIHADVMMGAHGTECQAGILRVHHARRASAGRPRSQRRQV